jgi:hypothetical protein
MKAKQAGLALSRLILCMAGYVISQFAMRTLRNEVYIRSLHCRKNWIHLCMTSKKMTMNYPGRLPMLLIVTTILITTAFTAAAQPGRADDSLRVMAGTMHFPSPFAFTTTGTSQLSGAKLFTKCTRWADAIGDTLQGVTVQKNMRARKIIIQNVAATADISCTVSITIKKNSFTCSLTNYMFHPINGGALPVDKAAAIKSNQPTVNIEKLLISRNYQHIFQSLDGFIKKPA